MDPRIGRQAINTVSLSWVMLAVVQQSASKSTNRTAALLKRTLIYGIVGRGSQSEKRTTDFLFSWVSKQSRLAPQLTQSLRRGSRKTCLIPPNCWSIAPNIPCVACSPPRGQALQCYIYILRSIYI
ncbi:unnamed protein product, partial [Laminaria digitata]